MALLNINNLNGIILPLNAGYGSDDYIEIEDKVSGIGTELKEYKGGIKIPIFSLKTLLELYSDKLRGELLLKMDCEGCEYNLLNEDNDVLRKFKRMQIEYHNGYNSLKNKLEKAGFKVKYTKPQEHYSKETNRKLIQGYIYAVNTI